MKTLGRLWLIGGTQESAELARAIAQQHLPCTISVTTESARALYPNASTLEVKVGRLNAEQLQQLISEQQIVAILDASHPYAIEISQTAIALATQLQIPYLRYERPSLETPHPSPLTPQYLDSFDTLLASDALTGQRVLLTIGYRALERFRPWQDRATLFARILPSTTALEAAMAAGFSPDRLIAFRPPLSIELEKALWQHWQISLVVTKASGTPGGEDIKRQVAAELGVQLVAIARPRMNYPQQTSDLKAAIEFCQHYTVSGSMPS